MKKFAILALTTVIAASAFMVPAKASTATQNLQLKPTNMTAAIAYAYHPTVSRGDTGSDVRVLQDCLVYLGYSLDADGIFGARTESSVKSFQRSHGLTPDGIVGSQTWNALNNACGGIS